MKSSENILCELDLATCYLDNFFVKPYKLCYIKDQQIVESGIKLSHLKKTHEDDQEQIIHFLDYISNLIQKEEISIFKYYRKVKKMFHSIFQNQEDLYQLPNYQHDYTDLQKLEYFANFVLQSLNLVFLNFYFIACKSSIQIRSEISQGIQNNYEEEDFFEIIWGLNFKIILPIIDRDLYNDQKFINQYLPHFNQFLDNIDIVQENFEKIKGHLNIRQINQLIYITLFNFNRQHNLQIKEVVFNMLNAVLLKPQQVYTLNQILFKDQFLIDDQILQMFDTEILKYVKNQLEEIYKYFRNNKNQNDQKTTIDNIKKIFELKILILNLNYFDQKMEKKLEIFNIAQNIEDSFELQKYITNQDFL